MLSIVGEVRPDIGKRREARGDEARGKRGRGERGRGERQEGTRREARGDEARGKRGRGERGWKVVARCTLHVGRFPNP